MTSVYLESHVTAHLVDGRAVRALVYVVDRGHAQYSGRLSLDETLRLVRQGQGVSGLNPDYVLATQDHLAELGIHDRTLAWLAARLRPAPGETHGSPFADLPRDLDPFPRRVAVQVRARART